MQKKVYPFLTFILIIPLFLSCSSVDEQKIKANINFGQTRGKNTVPEEVKKTIVSVHNNFSQISPDYIFDITDQDMLIEFDAGNNIYVKVEAQNDQSETIYQGQSEPETYYPGEHVTIVIRMNRIGEVEIVVNNRSSFSSFSFLAKDNPDFLDYDVVASINQEIKSIFLEVPPGTDLSNLVAHFEPESLNVMVGEVKQISSLTANDFSNSNNVPIIYKVSSETVNSQKGKEESLLSEYQVRVAEENGFLGEITSFYFSQEDNPGLSSDFNGIITGKEITVNIPLGLNVTNLKARFLPENLNLRVKGLKQTSGETPNDFSTEVVYQLATDEEDIFYLVNVVLVSSTEARLSDLTFSAGSLDQLFSSDVYNYTLEVMGTNHITLNPKSIDPKATIEINGIEVFSGTESDAISLSMGSNNIVILVTAEDDLTTATYTINANRILSNEARLSNLFFSNGSLSPSFSSDVYNYTLNLGDILSIVVKPVAMVLPATIETNGNSTPSGFYSDPIYLNSGSNNITIVITAQDGATTKTYSIDAIRNVSSEARLSSLIFSAGSLDQSFSRDVYDYILTVEGASSITVTPTAQDGTATIEVDGNKVSSGSASNPVNLNYGSNNVNIFVTAKDGVSTKTYSINAIRNASSEARLSSLTFSDGNLSPVFSGNVYSYSLIVSDESDIEVTPVAQNLMATIEVDGDSVNSGYASNPISLNYGDNNFNVVVTAEDSISTKTYSINAQNCSSELSDLTLSTGSFFSPFNKLLRSYSVMTLDNDIRITPTVFDPNAIIEVNGSVLASGFPSEVFSLSPGVGTNIIDVEVSALDGITTSYTIHVGKINYLKASNTEEQDHFGDEVAISGDTVVVGVIYEDSNSTGVNNSDDNNLASNSGAAYVFVRSGGVWSQQAYLKASNTEENDIFGASVAISGDTIVVGAPREDSNFRDILNGDGFSGSDDGSADDSGAVYVFTRTGDVWSQQAYLKSSNSDEDDFFGGSVAISGDILVVGSSVEDSNGRGVDGEQHNNFSSSSGAAYVFSRTGNLWSQEAYLKASNADSEDNFGCSVAVSGNTIVVGAKEEDSDAIGVNGLEGNSSSSGYRSGAAYVFVKSGGVWSQEAYLKASNTGRGDYFGDEVAISGDTIVVSTSLEDSDAVGVTNGSGYSGEDNPGDNYGAAYVFVRDAGLWSQQAYLKASNSDKNDAFGASISISGDTIVVGAPLEDSTAKGINGYQINSLWEEDHGAAYVFVRDAGLWSQQAYLKASNTNVGDLFGGSVAISGDTIVSGASNEGSNATGINGDQDNQLESNSGAVFIFE